MCVVGGWGGGGGLQHKGYESATEEGECVLCVWGGHAVLRATRVRQKEVCVLWGMCCVWGVRRYLPAFPVSVRVYAKEGLLNTSQMAGEQREQAYPHALMARNDSASGRRGTSLRTRVPIQRRGR